MRRLLFLLLSVLLAAQVYSFPHGVRTERTVVDVVRRLDSPITVSTTSTSNTPNGVVTEICTITLTPTTDAQGNPQVIEVKQCVTTTDSGSGGASISQSTAEGASASDTASAADSASATDSASDMNATPSASAADSASASATENAPLSVNPVSSVSPSASADTATAASAPPSDVSPSASASASETGANTAASATSSAASATNGTADQSTASGTAAAENASESASASATPFAIPGKTLSVLPIGLGVFAGISVIALIVVALVTYERTKYRRAFRQRKLAEAGAAMGYGGMVQRA